MNKTCTTDTVGAKGSWRTVPHYCILSSHFSCISLLHTFITL